LIVFQSIPTSLKKTFSEPRIIPTEKIKIENKRITGIRYNKLKDIFNPIKYIMNINGINPRRKLISSLPNSVNG
jgi:effector-binding domain-containing protein